MLKRCSKRAVKVIFKSKPLLFLGLLLSVFVAIDWLPLACISLWTFSTARANSNNSVAILLIADPQLIGYRDEPNWIGWLSRWDVDRFMRRSYSKAFGMVNPSLEIFLGDLFDEGTTMSNREFEWTFQRFNEIFPIHTGVDRIYIPGDNDIGGEMEPIFPHLFERFHRRFPPNISNHSNQILSIFQIDPLGGFGLKSIFNGSVETTLHILLSHQPITRILSAEMHKILNHNGINIVLSAHDHVASIYERDQSMGLRVNKIKSGKISRHLQLTPPQKSQKYLADIQPLVEFQSPTVSYRMGVPHIGYGVLVLKPFEDWSKISIDFQVIWIPGRYPQLLTYLIFVVLMLIYLISSFCLKRIKIWKNTVYKKLEEI